MKVKSSQIRTDLARGISLAAIRSQISRIWPAVLISLGAAGLGIVLVLSLSQYFGVKPSRLTMDATTVCPLPFFVGLQSNVGIMLWGAMTGICFWSATWLKRNRQNLWNILFLLSSGGICLFLMLDDALLLHEAVFPAYLHIPGDAVQAGYLVMMAAYLIVFWRQILELDYLIFVLALIFFGLSLTLDLFFVSIFAEDSLKFVGITLLLVYFARAAGNIIRNSTGEGRKGEKKAD